MRCFEGPLMSQYQKVKHLELVEVPQWKNHPPLMRGDFFRARLPSGSGVLFGSSPALPSLPELRFLSIPSFSSTTPRQGGEDGGLFLHHLLEFIDNRPAERVYGSGCVLKSVGGGGVARGGAVLFYWSGVSLVQTQISVLRFHRSLAVGV